MMGEGCLLTLHLFVLLQCNQKVNARWTTDEQLLAVQGEFPS